MKTLTIIKKILIARMRLLVPLVFVLMLLIPSTTLAAATDEPTAASLLNSINEIVNFILQAISMILWPVIGMIGSLLDNELIFGGAMGTKLQALWVQIRNLVNVGFVLVLLAIAVYNVLGLGEENSTVPLGFKAVMPRFVITLLLVNFSFLGVKVVLDFTNVLTGAVFALPATVGSKNDMPEIMEGFCKSQSKDGVLIGNCKDGKLTDKARSFFSNIDRSNIGMVYAIKFGQAHQFKFVKDSVKDITQLGFNIVFNTVLFIVYAASFIALFVVLLLRLVVLWVAVVASPILAVIIAFPPASQLLGGGGDMKEKFINNALAPIKIGLIMSVGYIMLDAFQTDPSVHGGLLASNSLSSLDPNALVTGITDLQQLMVAVASVVIIWSGVFKVADTTVASGITGFIKEKLQSAGTLAAKLPTYLPAIPMPDKGMFGGKPISLQNIKRTFEDAEGQLNSTDAGRSLWGRGKPNAFTADDRANVARLSNPTDINKYLNDNKRVLLDPEGWKAIRDVLLKAHRGDHTKQGKIKEGFAYGKSLRDFNGDASQLFGTLGELTNFREISTSKLKDDAEANLKATAPAPDDTSAAPTTPTSTAPKLDTPAEAKNHTGPVTAAQAQSFTQNGKAFEGWPPAQVEEFFKLPENVRNVLIDSLNTNGKIASITVPQIQQYNAFQQAVIAAPNDGGKLKAAVEIAKSVGLPESFIANLLTAIHAGDIENKKPGVFVHEIYTSTPTPTPVP